MSRVPSAAPTGPSYWAYTAGAMGSILDDILETGEIRGSEVPKGVYSGISYFFDRVLEAAAEEVQGRDPYESLSNYHIAASSVACGDNRPNSLAELDERLVRYADFIKHLEKPRRLTQEETRLGTELRGFFDRICEEGENRAYEKATAWRGGEF